MVDVWEGIERAKCLTASWGYLLGEYLCVSIFCA